MTNIKGTYIELYNSEKEEIKGCIIFSYSPFSEL